MVAVRVVKTGQCPVCGKQSQIKIPDDDYMRLELHIRDVMAGQWKPIQETFPHWSAEMREKYISGTHGACWESLWGDEDEEDNDE